MIIPEENGAVNFEFDEVTDITDTTINSENSHISTNLESAPRVSNRMKQMTSQDDDDMEPHLNEQDGIFDAPFEDVPAQILDGTATDDVVDLDNGLEFLGNANNNEASPAMANFMHPGPSNILIDPVSGAPSGLGQLAADPPEEDDDDDSQVRVSNGLGEDPFPSREFGQSAEGKPQPLHLPQMPSSPGADDDEDEEAQPPPAEGSYDPADYEHLDVGPELKELFSFITRYTPQNIELEHRLRPYIPDYIPAVGDIDAFIKIPRPDNEPSTIGLTVLDEPSARQSDSNLLDLQLRAVAKHTTARSTVVKRVENGEKNAKVVEKWIKDISELHRAKPPPTVHYSKRMPDIDSLMQEWAGEVEDLLKGINLPSAALQVELPHYVDIICAILDIPVYKSRIQSLHILFTLYSVFKSSAHFRHLAAENMIDNNDNGDTADRLVIQ